MFVGTKFQKIRSKKFKKNEEREDFKEFRINAKRSYDKSLKRLQKEDEDDLYQDTSETDQ
jgi:hypothetical protein